MDGIAAITSRIAEIRGTLAAFAPPPVATATASAGVGTTSSTSSSAGFAAALASEVSRTAPPAASGAP